ncbi:MAG: TSUP family transporter [Oscillospiraceae bacterium]|nr:TSUP family transporter [Oscillospiraceae bacterium]
MTKLDLVTFLIVCPMVGIAGFVDAIAGGGGFISLPAYLISGIPPINAIATNKISSSMGTAVATVRYGRMGYITARYAFPAAALALVGSWLGAMLAMKLSDEFIRIAMIVLLPVMAFYVLRSKRLSQDCGSEYPPKKTMLLTMAIAFPIGIYDGFYGPGTGTLLMTLLVGAAHYSLNSAAGTTKVINLSTNIAALFTFLFSGKTLFVLGLTAGAFNIAGAYLGTKFFSEKGATIAKPMIIIVICIFFIKVVGEMAGIF